MKNHNNIDTFYTVKKENIDRQTAYVAYCNNCKEGHYYHYYTVNDIVDHVNVSQCCKCGYNGETTSEQREIIRKERIGEYFL